MRKISIISLFPQALDAYLKVGMLAKANLQGIVEFELIDLRQFGIGPRQQVDDTPYGGGDGMILRIEPLVAAIEAAQATCKTKARVILLTPRGKLFKQERAQVLADSTENLILIGGRYEGYDERLFNWTDEQISIGNYVLTGAELPALIVVDSVVRLIKGVLGGETSAYNESFSDPAQLAVEHPQYTKPQTFRDLKVPPVLLSGNHQSIKEWRNQQVEDFKL